jgi:glycosyltransferase involved in cell wall biosynthesis
MIPFFSILIPTRNRYETLQYAILTVLNQNFQSFELIIADNSDEETVQDYKLISQNFDDSRIKYCRPSTVLAMSDNYEFAVSQAIGEYIIIFGDDDGLVANSLEKIFAIIKKTKANIVSWARVEYSWPDRIPQQYSNLLVIPYVARTGVINSKKYIKRIISYRNDYSDYRYLPMFYNSAISKNLVKSLKEKTGRVFNAFSPDIYSGYAFAHLEKEYITIGHPLSINGVSSKSNGAAQLNEDNLKKADFIKLNSQSTIKWPQSIPEIPTVYLNIIEPFVQLTSFFPELNKYISKKKIYKNTIDNLESVSKNDLEEKVKKILASAENDESLYRWVVNYLSTRNLKVSLPLQFDLDNKIGFDGSHLVLDGSKFGLKNVYDVSLFINDLFGNLKSTDYTKPTYLSLTTRFKKAVALVLKGR